MNTLALVKDFNTRRQALPAILAIILGLAGPALAQNTQYWQQGTNASWQNAGNWVPNADGSGTGAVPTSSTDVHFNVTASNSVATTLTLDGNGAANSIAFDNTAGTGIKGNSSGNTARIFTLGAGGITVSNLASGNTAFLCVSPALNPGGQITYMLSAPQTWQNNSVPGSTLSLQGNNLNIVSNGANQLTFSGSGDIFVSVSGANAGKSVAANFSGTGGLVKSGTGLITFGTSGPDNSGKDRWEIGNNNGGDFTMQQGTLNVVPVKMILCGGAATNGNYTQTGGTATHTPNVDAAANGLYIGAPSSGTASNATFFISGGSFQVVGTLSGVFVGASTGSALTANLNIGGGSSPASFVTPNVHIGTTTNGTGNVNLMTNGTLTTVLIDKTAGTGNLYFDGGTLQVGDTFGFGGTLLSNVLTAAQIKNGGATIDSNGESPTIAQGFANFPGHTGWLAKIGTGTLTLSGTNTFTGPTIINGGTLALSGSGSLASGSITNNGTFDLSAVNGGYHLGTGKTLFGAGTINGPVTVDAGATITVGGAVGTPTGSLSCNGNLTLNGTEVVRIDKHNAANDTISTWSGMTINGTLEIHLINGGVSNGDQFQLFTGFGISVNSVNITGDSIAPLVWDTSQLSSGILKVASVSTPPTLTGPSDASGQCSATLTASATGTPPLVYIWKLDGAPLASGTNLTSVTISTPSSPAAHQVSLVVTNSAGRSLTNTANLTVQDTSAPVITLNGNNPLSVPLNGIYVDPGVTAIDNCNASPKLTTNNTVNTAQLGTYTNSYTADDGNGNLATNTRVNYVLNSFVWTNPGGDSWNNAANWSNNIIANGAGVPADFSTVPLAGPAIVTLDNNWTVGGLRFDDQSGNSNSWTFTNSELTLAVASGSPVIGNNVKATIATAGLSGSQGFTKTGTGILVIGTTASAISGNINIESGILQLGGSGAQLTSATNILGTTNSGSGTVMLRVGPSTAAGTVVENSTIIVSSNAPSGAKLVIGSNPILTGRGDILGNIILQHDLWITNSGVILSFNNSIVGANYDVHVDLGGRTVRFNPLYSGTTQTNDFRYLYIHSGQVQTGDGGTGGNNNAIGDNADVMIYAGAQLGFSANDKFGALNGDVGAIVRENYGANNVTFSVAIGNNNHDGIYNGVIWLADGANTNNPLKITKIGTGTQVFNGNCSNTAPTTISGGTLVINSAYFASAITNSATLSGVGVLASNVTVLAGGTLAPGTNNIPGTLTINNNLTLAGDLLIKINKSLAPSNDFVAVGGVLTNSGSGTVTVTNLNANPSFAFANGDKFTLFSQPLANGTNMTISPSSPGPGLAWTNNLALDGSIGVYSTGVAPSTNAFLTSLVVSSGALNPAFTTNNLNYSQTNAYVNNPVTVTATAADAGAKLELSFNGGAFGQIFSGISSAQQTLILPNNTVAVRVTAADTATTQTYTVNVTLQPSLTPAKLTNSVSGSTLTLSWPADHLGWHLQMQTNSLGSGLKTSGWVVVPGSDQMTSTNISITKTNPTVFYRITYP
jgi:autotransporter-associated beta strand protein